MAAVRNLQFVLSGRDKSASSALDKVGRKADGLGSKLAGIGKAAAFGVGGVAVAAVGGLAAAMVGGIKDAQAYQELGLKTAAAIKSTGNAANTSVKDVQKLAGELESLSGVDEELIINGQNVLLTFTKVRNEVGKGNDIFDRATEAALNMSVALGTDMQGSVTMLGKALNDPIKGIAAMGKAGIQFSKDQKKQIKTLVDSGKTLDAQKIILKELEVQFGGVAKAAGSGLTGSIARAKDAFGDLFRNMATPLLPKIAEWAEKFAVVVNDKIAPAILRFMEGFEKNKGAGGEFRANLVSLGDSARDAWPHIKTTFEKTKQIVDFVIKHKDAFETIAKGVATYAVAMKAAAIASSAMAGIKLGAMALGIGSVGTASAAAAPGVGALGTAASRSAGPIAALAAALVALDSAGKLDGWGGAKNSDINQAIDAVKKGDGGKFWDAIWGEGFSTAGGPLATWSDRQKAEALDGAKNVVPRPSGSSLDRTSPLNPTTPTSPTFNRGGQVAHLSLNMDSRVFATATTSATRSATRNGATPNYVP